MLRAGRVAAFLTLATGINGAIATVAPRYEPIYAYLVSIAIVAWLGSLLLGITAAVAAVIVYDFMFAPVRAVPTMSAIVPLAIAVAVAVATRMVRAPLTSPRIELPPTVPPTLLASPESIDVEMAPPPDRSAEIEELEQRLSGAMATADREARLRAEAAAATRFRVAALQREVDDAREQVVQQVNRVAALRAELDTAKRLPDEAKAEHEKAVTALQRELEQARRKMDDERKRTIADLTAKYQAPLAEAKKSLEEAFTRIPQLEQEAAQLEADLAAARKSAEEAVVRTELEKSQRERQGAEFDQKLERVVDTLTKDYEESLGQAMVDRESSRAEVRTLQNRLTEQQRRVQDIDKLQAEVTSRAASSEARAAELSREIERLQAEVATQQNRADRESLLREQLEVAGHEKLQNIVSDLSAKYDNAIADAQEVIGRLHKELDGTRAETRATLEAANEKIAQLQADVAAARKYGDSVAELAAKHENALGDARQKIAQLQNDLATARKAAEDVTVRAELEKAQRERESLDYDEKIDRIVAGLTKDYEESIGQATIERESARAELRSFHKKVQDLERRLLEGNTLQGEVDEARRQVAEEKAARERLDVEWNAKLQRIVSNIAIDHEHDMGEALLQREGAKAEVRSLTGKLHALQHRYDQEREKWNQERVRYQNPTAPMVLVVHSNAGVRMMSKQALEESGYVVMTAADGLEGLRVASAQKPAVVLAEAVMPKMNGRELVQLLKSRSETAGVKIVLVGGTNGGENANEFRPDDVIASITDVNLMRAALANVLSKPS